MDLKKTQRKSVSSSRQSLPYSIIPFRNGSELFGQKFFRSLDETLCSTPLRVLGDPKAADSQRGCTVCATVSHPERKMRFWIHHTLE